MDIIDRQEKVRCDVEVQGVLAEEGIVICPEVIKTACSCLLYMLHTRDALPLAIITANERCVAFSRFEYWHKNVLNAE